MAPINKGKKGGKNGEEQSRKLVIEDKNVTFKMGKSDPSESLTPPYPGYYRPKLRVDKEMADYLERPRHKKTKNEETSENNGNKPLEPWDVTPERQKEIMRAFNPFSGKEPVSIGINKKRKEPEKKAQTPEERFDEFMKEKPKNSS